MQNARPLQKMTSAALLIALGIVIPMFMPFPFKIMIEPASYTLASHVPVILSMFISPAVAAAVALGTTLGFFLGGFPLVIVLRAASHIVFAVLGAWYLQKNPKLLSSAPQTIAFALVLALIHAACEVIVVTAFYSLGGMGEAYYARGYLVTVMGLVGVGTIIHSMVDFGLSVLILKVLSRQKTLRGLFVTS